MHDRPVSRNPREAQRFQGKRDAQVAYQKRKGRPSRQGVSPARKAALDAVSILRTREAFAQDIIDAHIDRARMSPEDRAFATKLVLGVASSRGTLDEVLDRCMRTPEDVTPEVRDALCISAYEIIFLRKSAHAAVDQGVELVRSIAPRAAGLANAVLRKVVSAAEEFPFGDPGSNLEAFARLHAFPAWLARKIVDDLGPEAARLHLVASNEPAPVYIGVNAAKASDEEVLSLLGAVGDSPALAEVCDVVIPGCFRLQSGRVLVDGRVRRALSEGKLLVSDAAAQAVARFILPEEKPSSLLEVGAGRATKTILLQSNAQRLWGSQIEEYVTLDNHAFKTKLLAERAAQYGVSVSEALTGDATNLDAVLGGRSFDVVFIDAPCTGLGTLRRHPEIRWRLRPEIIDEYASLGLRMLKTAAAHVTPGGTLAYATCTITREENVGVVKAFLESPEGAAFKLVPIAGRSSFAPLLAPGTHDAHFAIKMVKVG